MFYRYVGVGLTRLHLKQTVVDVSLAIAATDWSVDERTGLIANAFRATFSIQDAMFPQRTSNIVTLIRTSVASSQMKNSDAGVGLTRLPLQLTLISVRLIVAATDRTIDICTAQGTDTRGPIVVVLDTLSVEGTFESSATVIAASFVFYRDVGVRLTRFHPKETVVVVSMSVAATNWIVYQIAHIIADALGTILRIQYAVFVHRASYTVTTISAVGRRCFFGHGRRKRTQTAR